MNDVETLRSIISPTKKNNQPEQNSDQMPKKEFCEWCVEGFDPNTYYEHTCLVHFRHLFEDVILPANTRDMK